MLGCFSERTFQVIPHMDVILYTFFIKFVIDIWEPSRYILRNSMRMTAWVYTFQNGFKKENTYERTRK